MEKKGGHLYRSTRLCHAKPPRNGSLRRAKQIVAQVFFFSFTEAQILSGEWLKHSSSSTEKGVPPPKLPYPWYGIEYTLVYSPCRRVDICSLDGVYLLYCVLDVRPMPSGRRGGFILFKQAVITPACQEMRGHSL